MEKAKPKTPARKKPRSCILPLKDLQRLHELQMRAGGLSEDHVLDLTEAVKKGVKLPRVRVWELSDRNGQLVVTDGFHTCESHKRAGRATVACEVYQGTWADAVLDAAGANQQHLGLKRTNADKRRAVEMVKATVGENWSHRKIADHLGVSPTFVGSVINSHSNDNELSTVDSSLSSEDKTVGNDGKIRGPKHHAPKAPESDPDSAADWRSVPLTQFLKADDHVWESVKCRKLTTAGKLDDAIAKGDTLGIGRMDLEDVRQQLAKLKAAVVEEPGEQDTDEEDTPIVVESDDAPSSTPVPPAGGKGGNDDPPPTSPPPVPAAALPIPAKREKDKVGVDIPDSLLESWEEEKGFVKDFRDTLKAMLETLEEARQRPYLAAVTTDTMISTIKSFSEEIDSRIKNLMPHALCPNVNADGTHDGKAQKCPLCRGSQFLPKGMWDQLTPEQKSRGKEKAA